MNTRPVIALSAMVISSLFAELASAQPPQPPAISPHPTPITSEMGPKTMVGKFAPDFALPDQNDKKVALKNAKGKWVVLAFYPADMTPGCTLQNKAYSAGADEFAPLNAVVYTISTQGTDSKKQFCAKEGLKHTLLSDVGGKTARKYGVLRGSVARRVTFYIAPDGTIAAVDDAIRVQTASADSVEMLKNLQAQQTPPAAP